MLQLLVIQQDSDASDLRPQTTTVGKLLGHLVDGCVLIAMELGRLSLRLRQNRLIEGRPRNEEIDEVAIEGIGGTAKRVESDRFVRFAALHPRNARLANIHTCGELGARHAEGFPDSSDPAPVRSGLLRHEAKPFKPCVEVGSDLGTSFRHLAKLSSLDDERVIGDRAKTIISPVLEISSSPEEIQTRVLSDRRRHDATSSKLCIRMDPDPVISFRKFAKLSFLGDGRGIGYWLKTIIWPILKIQSARGDLSNRAANRQDRAGSTPG